MNKLLFLLTIATGLLIASMILPIGCHAATPQSNLPMTKMKLGEKTFNLEIAATEGTRQTGLMYRDSMPADHGMVFVFEEDEKLSFWMKNTRIPLDIIYINGAGKVVSIKQMEPYDLTGTPSDAPARFAIELNKGAASKAGVKVGDQLSIPDEVRNPKPATRPAKSE